MPETQALTRVEEPQEEVSCPLCGGDSRTVVMLTRDRLFGRPGFYRIVRCNACALRYLSPRPTPTSLRAHYPDAYFIYKRPEQEHPLLRPMARMFDRRHWLSAMRRIERRLGRFSADTQVVDVGCGLNQLLTTLKRERGTQGIGVDFKAEIASYVRDVCKMPVVHGTLYDGHFADERFDVVTMNEYLEHEPDPRGVLAEARRITRPGGHLWIEVPRSDCLPARLFGSRWAQIDAPRHLVHFTPETLTHMLERSGYRVMYVGTFKIPLLIGMSVLQALGASRLGALTLLDTALMGLCALPFGLLYPWLDEFMYVAARAE